MSAADTRFGHARTAVPHTVGKMYQTRVANRNDAVRKGDTASHMFNEDNGSTVNPIR